MNQFTKMIKTSEIFNFLSGLDLFKKLPEKQLCEIAKLFEIQRYRKNEIVFNEKQKAQNLYIVYSGMIKIYKLSSGGKEHILHTLSSGKIFAEVPMFEGETYPAYSATLANSVLLTLSRQHLLQLVTKEPQIALNMLALQAKRLRELTVQIEGLTLKDTLSRLAYYLLKQADQNGVISQKISITDRAKLLGITRENLSKLLSRLGQEQIIHLVKNDIRIKNKRRLLAIRDGINCKSSDPI